jgi:phage-related protein
MAIGPRVGGAHVDVNMKFDEKSLAQVGKQIHRQLAQLGKSLQQVGDRNRKIYQEIGKDSVTAWRALMGSILAGAPLVGSAISGVAGAATVLAGSLYSATQASFGFAPLLLSIGVAAGTAFIGLKSFFKALKDGDLSGLTPSAKAAAKAVQGLAGAWDKVRNTVQENLFKGLADDIAKLGTTLLPTLERGLGKMATSLNHLAQNMLDYVNSSAGLKVINKFLDNMAEIFDRFQAAVVPFLDGFLRLMNALSPAAKRLADRIADIAVKFQDWTKAEGFGKRIDDMMKRAEKTAGLLFKVLGNLGAALANVFNAANPATNRLLEMLVGLTDRFKVWTESVGGQNAIAKWADQSVDVIAQFGRTVEAIFPVIAELADPRVIISFLKTVQGAFELLGKLPLDKIVSAFVTLSEALQPVSSFFLAIIIGGAALNILLGGLIGQLGGVVSILSKFIQFKIITNILKGSGGAAGGAATKVGLFRRVWEGLLRIITKVKTAFSGVVGFFSKTGAATGQTASKASKLATAFKPVLSILGRFVKFAGPVGIAVWIGIIIAKSKDLQEKLVGVWDAVKEVFASLGGAFSEIGTALKPLAPVAEGAGKAFGFIFEMLDKVAEIIIGFALDAIIYGFKSLAKVIEGLGHIIAGLINVLVGLFTLDFGKVWEGLKQMASGVLPLLEGIFGLFISFFAPARLAKIGLGLVKGLGSGIVRAIPGILATVGRFLGTIIKFFATLPFKLLALGVRAIVALGRAVITKGPSVLLQMGKLYVGIVKWILKLPGRLLQLGVQAITKLGGAVVRGTPKVLSAAGRIVSGVIEWIAKLPGRLLTLGGQAVSKLTTAIRNGLGSLKAAATDVVEAVVNIIKGLPGKLLNLASSLLNAGKTLGGKILEGIRSGITAIGDMASSVANDLKAGINNAIGLPKELSFSVLGKKIGFTIPGFEKGGIAPGGLIAVGEGGPELMAPPRGSRIYSNSDSKKMLGGGLPKTMILRVGDRDFVAYLEEVADGRINAADNLAWQGT